MVQHADRSLPTDPTSRVSRSATFRFKLITKHLVNRLIAVAIHGLTLGSLLSSLGGLLFGLASFPLSLLLGGLAIVLLALLVLAVISSGGGSLVHGSVLSLRCLGRSGRGGGGGGGGSRGIGAEVLVLGAPLGRGSIVGTTVLVELAVSLELLLLKGNRAETPSAGVEVALHDATLDLGNNTVVTGGHLNGGHLGNTQSDGLTLGGHEDNLLVVLNGSL